jgi:hypothetical protein
MVVDDETISLSASVPLKRTKQELAVLISSAMKTLQDIYFYEMAISSVKSLRMVCGLFLAIRLQMLLPIDSKHPNRRLWKELAILMTTSRLVIVSKGWFQTTEPNKQYKPDALRVMASDIQTGQFMRLPLAMKAVNPDFFCELEAGKGPEAMAGLQAGGKYHPTDEAIFTIGLANQFNLRGF